MKKSLIIGVCLLLLGVVLYDIGSCIDNSSATTTSSSSKSYDTDYYKGEYYNSTITIGIDVSYAYLFNDRSGAYGSYSVKKQTSTQTEIVFNNAYTIYRGAKTQEISSCLFSRALIVKDGANVTMYLYYKVGGSALTLTKG